MSGMTGFLNGLSSGIQTRRSMDRAKNLDTVLAGLAQNGTGSGTTAGGGFMPPERRGLPARTAAAINGGGSGSGGGGGSVTRLKTADPYATDLPAEARAFLNGVSTGESAGAYNVRYTPEGGAPFDLSGGHPRIYEDGPHGKSSAAGRYQFTYDTWKGYGGDDFSPAAQDRAAWALAQDRYKKTTGGDLLGDLQSGGMTDGMMEALAPTWAALGNVDARESYRSVYNDSLSRYGSAAEPEPAPTATPERRSLMAPGWTNLFGLDPIEKPQPTPHPVGDNPHFQGLLGFLQNGIDKPAPKEVPAHAAARKVWGWADEILKNTGSAA